VDRLGIVCHDLCAGRPRCLGQESMRG
jgi:hypothetical protein